MLFYLKTLQFRLFIEIVVGRGLNPSFMLLSCGLVHVYPWVSLQHRLDCN